MSIPDIFITRPQLTHRIQVYFKDLFLLLLVIWIGHLLIMAYHCTFFSFDNPKYSWFYTYRADIGYYLLWYVGLALLVNIPIHIKWLYPSEVARKKIK